MPADHGRAEVLLRGAHVISMDPEIGDLAGADIHVRDGRIVEIATGVLAPGANVIDARGMVAIPGFVDTHTHLWSGLLRGVVRDGSQGGYNDQKARYGPRFRPEDTYWATTYGLVEALAAGITSVHNWAHNIQGPAHADASVRAHRDIGLRGRFSYGASEGLAATSTMDLDDVGRIRSDLQAGPGGPDVELLDLGMAMRGPFLTPESVYRAEWEAARGYGLPVTIHYASYADELARVDALDALEAADLLDVDLQLVHALYATSAQRRRIRALGASVSSAPLAALRHGLGIPPLRQLLDDGVQVSLSLDTSALAGSLDMFAVMRTLLLIEHGQSRDDAGLAARTLLELATIEGARDLDIDHLVGSLTPGKRADLLLVDLGELAIGPVDPEHADLCSVVVYSGSPAAIDTVMVDGRIVKRAGRLTSVDVEEIKSRARSALAFLVGGG